MSCLGLVHVAQVSIESQGMTLRRFFIEVQHISHATVNGVTRNISWIPSLTFKKGICLFFFKSLEGSGKVVNSPALSGFSI